jgi:protein-S-isoprenylcysteine O-methyltransferase Ste14
MRPVTDEAESPWWRGERGEWYVAFQLVLMALVFLGPRTLAGMPSWPPAVARVAAVAGAALALGGGLLFLAALVSLGPNLTPLPRPKSGATLVQTGPHRFVRHPIYAGGLALAYGWALLVGGWLTLGYATVLFVFLDLKSAREERWLTETFPDYPDDRRRVRKLIPLVY